MLATTPSVLVGGPWSEARSPASAASVEGRIGRLPCEGRPSRNHSAVGICRRLTPWLPSFRHFGLLGEASDNLWNKIPEQAWIIFSSRACKWRKCPQSSIPKNCIRFVPAYNSLSCKLGGKFTYGDIPWISASQKLRSHIELAMCWQVKCLSSCGM